MGEFFEGKWYAYPPLRNALLAGLISGTAFGLGHTGLIPHSVEAAFYLLAIPLGGYHWMREGVEILLEEREVGIQFLMMAATFGSAALGMLDEAAFLVFLYGAAEGLEDFAYARTRASIRKLLDLAPKEARVVRNGKETIIAAEEIRVGDLFIVRPGESIPTDGVIVEGRSSVNEAPVTGESIPVEKREGMQVFAGTINQEGVLKVRATATFKDNTLSKLIHLVEEAQEEKSKTQLFIERFGRKYTPAVLGASALLALVPPLLGAPFSEWATRAVVLLVAAAPCALVMSTPVAIASGIGKAGRSGVLIKGGIHLENLGRIKVVAFDKTGTLTWGRPVVTDVIAGGGSEREVLRLALSVERFSEHPLAKAVVKKAREMGLEPLDASDFKALSGYGVKAKVDGRLVVVGKPRLFERMGLEVEDIFHMDRLKSEGKTVILVGTEEGVEGAIAIRDEIRPRAKEALRALKRMGLKIVMLTGDNPETAKAVAGELRLDEVRADLKPEEKLSALRDLEREYGFTAMVGDGVNDAPALARATVGIAMGVAGTDAAIEAADVALMSDDLTKVPYAINLGRRVRRISLENIVFSITLLAVLIPLALLGVLSPAGAVLVHEASELLAVANGLRAGR